MKKLLLVIFLFMSVSFYGQNFWVPTNGPNGGSVRSLAINSSGHIFAGTYGSGVYRSTDNGNTWSQVSTNFRYSIVYSIAINGNGHLFAGTYGEGVYRSTDNGNTWTQINSGLTSTKILSLLINNSGSIVAGTDRFGIFISTDNGNNWSNNGNSGSSYAMATNRKANSALFAATTGEIYRSTNDGNNWARMVFFSNYFTGNFTSLAINISDNIFAGHTSYVAVFRSTDNGINWTQMAQTNNNAFKNTHVYSLAINGGGQIFAGTENDGIFRSTDNGVVWVQINSGLTDNYVTALAINSVGFVFAGTNKGEVFRSADKTTSVNESSGKIPTTFYLSQNYPNPFNPSTTINYSVPQESFVTIKVYDVLGREVATLIDEYKQPGNYNINFNSAETRHGASLQSGVYFYRLQAGEFNKTKKFILMK